MNWISNAMWLVLVAFAAEEFVLIKPVSTMAQSDPVSRRLELAAIWVPAAGIGIASALLVKFGGLRLGGLVNIAGFLLCVVGLALRYWSRRTLGQYFTIGVVAQAGHQVIESGPYRIVRHPAYLAFILLYCGLAMLMGSAPAALLIALPALVIFPMLCLEEDRQLEAKLGSRYADFRARRARLVPGVW